MVKRVLITGASSDIGLALTRRYLDAGWSVLGHCRTRHSAFDDFDPERFSVWQCDFADTAGLESALAANAESLKAVDAFVSLAAEVTTRTMAGMSAQDYLRAVAVNVVPGLLLTQLIGPGMVARGFGRIVHGGSIGVKFGGSAKRVPYGFSKHAQEFIPNEMRSWASRNVYVNVARIGVTDTRLHDGLTGADRDRRTAMIPARRMASPDEIAATLHWLGSEQNTFVAGETIAVAGGE